MELSSAKYGAYGTMCDHTDGEPRIASARSVRKVNRHSRGLRRTTETLLHFSALKVRNTDLVLNAYPTLEFLAFLHRTGSFEPPMALDSLIVCNTPSRARGQVSPWAQIVLFDAFSSNNLRSTRG